LPDSAGCSLKSGERESPYCASPICFVPLPVTDGRVTVLRRLCRERGAERAAGAGLVVDEHPLAPLGGELLRERARDDVQPAARGVGRDDLERTLGEGLRVQRRDEGEQRSDEPGLDGHLDTVAAPWAPWKTGQEIALRAGTEY
jgi:hypothetical protein